MVIIHPGRQYGAPTIGNTRITCTNIAGMVWAGDNPTTLAEDYELTPDEILVGCWYVARNPERGRQHKWQRDAAAVWKEWAHHWQTHTYHPTTNTTHPGNPPQREP